MENRSPSECLEGLILCKVTGKERDTESGNDYFGARYYGSSMGRFLSPDYSDEEAEGSEPIPFWNPTNPQSLNLYSYVRNNPLGSTDPDGHDVNVCTTDSNGNQKCTEMSNEQYQQASQNNGSLNVPTLNQVGNNQTNGTFNATAITDANGNTVGTATYVPTNPGIDPFVGNNMAGYQTLGAASKVVNVMGGVEMTALSFAMPELLSTALPETTLGTIGSGVGTTIVHGAGRLALRGISKEAAEEAIQTAKQAGNVTTKIGRYGQLQTLYKGSNGITVVVQEEGRNAGSIITAWWH